MSGIAGIYNLDGRPVDGALLEQMTDLLAHRGPDAVGHWVSGPVGLGHCMLATTPEALHERQPLPDETARLALVFDGRVDNPAELRDSLLARGTVLRDDTDAELVLRGYECWGEGALERIIGDFAFAVWDAARRQLFCARDALGIRPFYYWLREGHGFLFASEMQPLFVSGEASRSPNLLLMARLLGARYDTIDETLYEEIRPLPAGHALCASADGVRRTRYYQIDPERTIRYRSEGEYVEHFREVLRDAVSCRLRSAGRVGIQVSGGLDSSSIACMAAGICRQTGKDLGDLETFSLQFRGMNCDETPYISAVVDKLGCPATRLEYADVDPGWLDLSRLERYPDLLFGFTSLMFTPMLDDMRRRGIRVLLDGCGGDELFEGDYVSVRALLRERHVRQAALTLQAQAALAGSSPWAFAGRRLERKMQACLGRIGCRPAAKSVPSPLLSPRFAATVSDADEPGPALPPAFRSVARSAVYSVIFGDGNATVALPNHDLLTARFAVEFRRPLCDQRLVEFMLALPPGRIPASRHAKGLLRGAMAGLLPQRVCGRHDKAELSAVLDREMRERQALYVSDVLEHPLLEQFGVLSPHAGQDLWRAYSAGSPLVGSGLLELLLSLETWCRHCDTASRRIERKESGSTAEATADRSAPPSLPAPAPQGLRTFAYTDQGGRRY